MVKVGCEKGQILDRFQEGFAAGLNVEYKERKETGIKSRSGWRRKGSYKETRESGPF